MKRIGILVLVLSVCLMPSAWAQHRDTFASSQLLPANVQQDRLYDDFSYKWLSPQKWLQTATVPFDTGNDTFTFLDQVRAVENGKLHLKVRTYGQRSSDENRNFGVAEVYFKSPNTVEGITTTFTPVAAKATACPANVNVSTSQTIILGGTFFNAGSGDPSDDVVVYVIFEHAIWDPSLTTVHGLAVVFTQNTFVGYLDLNNYRFGIPVTTTLRWDKANHQFYFRASTFRTFADGYIPYSLSDTLPVTQPLKFIGARAFVPNCTDHVTSGIAEVLVDNVYIR